MKRVVFAGHGAFNARTDRRTPKFTVPRGVTLVFWVPHGSVFVGSELDGNDPETLLSYMFLPEVQSRLSNMRSRRHGIRLPKGLTHSMPEVIRGGQQCWNYRLTPPNGLHLRPRPGDTNFLTVRDRRLPGNVGYRLQYLIEKHWSKCFRAEIHWAACRVVKPR